MNWLDNIRREDLHESYQELMDVMTGVIGDALSIELIMKLSCHYKGQFYFRSLQDMISDRKKKFIIANFNGDNHEELARKTNWSLRYIYDILAEDRNKSQLSFLN
jgi:Mor family transcriptional regulator